MVIIPHQGRLCRNFAVFPFTYEKINERPILRKVHCLQRYSLGKQQELSEQNKALALSQETQLALQIVEERNRIARDIHDNVGHLLSSAILQIGALEMINQEPN